MTLNQVLQRLRLISLSHKQIRTFKNGLVTDFLVDKTTKYPAVFLQDSGGSISTTAHATTLRYRMFFVDLVHVSEDTKDNEQDVHSDMVSIAMDMIAQMNSSNYDDWALSTDNSLQLLVEEDGDMYAGCYVDFSLRIMFSQNICQIPTDLTYETTDNDMKLVYDTEYVADGTEGTTLTLPELLSKKILLIVRANNPIHKASNAPAATEYTWDDTTIGLGTATTLNERFLILYRNY